MQANIELVLKTREVFKLFERRINGDRLFINAILHKFNNIMRQCKLQITSALVAYNQIEQALLVLTLQFGDELNRFEPVLAKHKDLIGKKINFIEQFQSTITVSTPLSIQLVKFIEIYDKLIAVLKLLHLIGCFSSEADYYANIKRIQTLTNKMLSEVILIPCTP